MYFLPTHMCVYMKYMVHSVLQFVFMHGILGASFPIAKETSIRWLDQNKDVCAVDKG